MRYHLRTLLLVLALGPPIAWMLYRAIQLVPIVLRDFGMPERSAPFH